MSTIKKDNGQTLIKSFLDVLISENGLSTNTVSSYKNDLDLFLKFLVLKQTNFLQVDENLFKQYLGELYKQGIKSSSLNRKISTTKSFFKFLETEGIKNNNPTLNIDQVKNNLKLPKYLSEKEVFSMLDFVEKDNNRLDRCTNINLFDYDKLSAVYLDKVEKSEVTDRHKATQEIHFIEKQKHLKKINVETYETLKNYKESFKGNNCRKVIKL